MKKWATKSGFTIVELLIVVVVIAVIAAIVTVSYMGVQQRARDVALQVDLGQAADKVQVYTVGSGGQYPADLSEVQVADTAKTTFQYTSNNSVSPKEFCVTATYERTTSYYVSNTSNGKKEPGICPGHNLIVWYESANGATTPVPAGTVDTVVFRGGDRSIRLGVGQTGRTLAGLPLDVVQGQVVTTSLWIRTDATWNGTAGNSKIRYGNQSGGALLNACSYNGVKATWTFVTCNYTVAAGISQLTISVGNDGTAGNIWLDDISLSVVGP